MSLHMRLRDCSNMWSTPGKGGGCWHPCNVNAKWTSWERDADGIKESTKGVETLDIVWTHDSSFTVFLYFSTAI